MHTYTVRRGESARSVAEKFGVPQAALLRENPAPFYEGQQVAVPVSVLNIAPLPPTVLGLYYQIPGTAILSFPDRVNILF